MGEDTAAIREEIEQTRARMGGHADALAYKADVPSRTKDRITGAKDSVMNKITGSTPDRGQVQGQADRAKGQAHKTKGIAENNPLGMAIGAAAVGFLAGLAIPSTKMEDEKLGPVADDLKDRATELGQEAMGRGKDVASDAAQAAKDTAQEKGQEQGSQMKDSAGQQASDAKEQNRS